MKSMHTLKVELHFDGQNPKDRLLVLLEIDMDFSACIQSDALVDTIDHYELRALINDILGKKPKLIETLAADIAEAIMVNFSKANTLRVTVTKVKTGSKNMPSATVRQERNSNHESILLDFDFDKVLHGLDNYGGISIPILSKGFRQRLLCEAESYEFIEKNERTGKAQVHEHFFSFTKIPYDSLLITLKEEFEQMVKDKMGTRPIFTPPLRLNEPTLQKYPVGVKGIEPHLDNSSWKNLICIFMLKGNARFGIVKDRSKNDPYILETTPGNVILMRAPGYRGGGNEIRPFHFIDSVTEERIVGSWRQNVSLMK